MARSAEYLGELSFERRVGGVSLLTMDDPFELMVDSIVDYAMFLLDPQGIVCSWNAGAMRMKGYTAEEIVGEHFSVFYSAEQSEAGMPRRALDASSSAGRHEDEGWLVRKDGSRFWANVVITALHDEGGALVGFAKVARDLTERRLAAEELATAYAHLNSVLESTSDSVMTISHKWILLYGNHRAMVSLPDFVVGKTYWSCFGGVLGTDAEVHLRRAMRERTEVSFEDYYVPYGTWYRVEAFPAKDGLSVFFSDITEEKKMQDQLNLEQLLREKRIEALSHMAGGLAHEISNPLAIIHGRAGDLRDLAFDETPVASQMVRMACDSILKTSERASSILRGLRGFAREASHDPMQLASICEIVEQSMELQVSRFRRHDIEVRLALRPDIPFLLCRETQIGQIMTNLLSNAFDAIVQSKSAERWVTVSAASDAGMIVVEVTDSGPGVADHFKAHLMEPFFTTKELGLGMGVGLSLSRAIAQDHGGMLTLCTGRENTCFQLVVPMLQEAAH